MLLRFAQQHEGTDSKTDDSETNGRSDATMDVLTVADLCNCRRWYGGQNVILFREPDLVGVDKEVHSRAGLFYY